MLPLTETYYTHPFLLLKLKKRTAKTDIIVTIGFKLIEGVIGAYYASVRLQCDIQKIKTLLNLSDLKQLKDPGSFEPGCRISKSKVLQPLFFVINKN